jgi:hypothetical protein
LTYQDIDPIFFAKTYYVGPDKGAEKTYSLLVKAMEDSELGIERERPDEISPSGVDQRAIRPE